MKSQIFLFGKKLFYFILMFLFSDILFGLLMDYVINSSKYSNQNIIMYACNKADEEVLIFGSSRANHHYVTNIIEDSLNLSCFNFGQDGQNIYYHKAIQELILARYNPKIMVLDLFDIDFLKTASIYSCDRLAVLLPLASGNENITELLLLRSKFERIKMLSNFYRYNSQLINILKDLCLKNSSFQDNGYAPLYGKLNDEKKRSVNNGGGGGGMYMTRQNYIILRNLSKMQRIAILECSL